MAITSGPAPQVSLSAAQARLISLGAQGFIGTGARRGGVPAMLRRLGAVQLDTISVLARSHELVAYARLGAIGREKVERAYWHPRQAAAFEYWSHAACVLPAEEWPYYEFRRRRMRARDKRWHEVNTDACDRVLAQIRADGPVTSTDLGGAKNGGPWWDWSETKIAVERLLDTGEVVCARRTGWRRVYDLPQRVLPAPLLAQQPTDEQCLTRLAATAGRALGVLTRADLADYQRVSYGSRLRPVPVTADDAALAAGLIPVTVGGADGSALPGWADPDALTAGEPAGRCRVTLLSPFDSLVWDRKRTRRMFGFDHQLEAYVPAAKRVHGYFTMPLLARGQLAGRVDPVRSGTTLIARQLSLDAAWAAGPMARALAEAATWVGCDRVALGRVTPVELEPRLRAALDGAGVSSAR